MTSQGQTQKDNTKDASPVQELSDLLKDDMEQVNTLIIQNMDSSVPLIPQLASYLIAAGGKRIRPLLTLACTKIHNGDIARAHNLAGAVEFIHTATLLHDDVVDESKERRGQAAANLIFGNQASVLVGDFLFSKSFQLMVKDGSLEILRILSDAAAIIAQGEVLQLSLAGNIDTSMDDYLRVIKAKTAALFAAACEVGPVIANSPPKDAKAMAEFGMNLGIAFQIIDDTLDYDADHAKLGKAIGDDFREGKITAPIILAIEKADSEEKEFWQRTLGEQDQKDGDLERAQNILAKHDTIQASTNMARDYVEKARASLTDVPNHELRDLLDQIALYTIARQH